jgi:hypothetical protein
LLNKKQTFKSCERTSDQCPGTTVEDWALHPWFMGIYGYQWWLGNFTGESGDFTAIAGVG